MRETIRHGLKTSWTRFLGGFYPEGIDSEGKRRIVLFVALSLIGIVNLLLFGSVAFLQRNVPLGAADYLSAAFLVANLLDTRLRKRFSRNIFAGNVLILFFYAFLFLTGGVKNTAFVWCYSFPLISFYLQGSKRGTAFTLLLTLPVLWHMAFDPGPPFAAYSMDFKGRFLFSYLVVGLFSFLFEHTRERNREELRDACDVLNRNVLDLKAAKSDLEAAKEKAEAASVAKSRFLANMSHEIRTPLNGMLGMAEVLLAADLREDHRRLAEIIDRSGESLLCVIDNILDLSKIEAGKVEIRPRDFEIREVFENVVALIGAFAQEKDVELSYRVGGTLPSRLRGDPDRLSQVLINLVNNAIKFTERGRVDLEGDLEADGDREVRVRFTVRDTGIGITPEVGKILFEPFTQGDDSSTRRYGGTGLGLSIAKQLVGLMGGTIGYSSEPGKGATFRFAVPLGKLSPGEGVGEPEQTGLAGMRILVAANPEACPYLSEDLAARGAETRSAARPGESPALLRAAALEGKPFHAVVLEAEGPGSSGLALAETIHRDPTIPALRFAMLVPIRAYPSCIRSRDVGNGPALEYLPKPVLHSQLEKCLRIPAATPGAVEEGETSLQGSSPIPVSGEGRLLAVDDNAINREVLTSMLDLLGYRCDVACNGLEAVEAFSRSPYDLVFMDCQMPVMDGFESSARIRGMEKARGLRRTYIVAVTGYAIRGDRERCLDAGMDDYLPKPYQMEQIRDIIGRWASARKP